MDHKKMLDNLRKEVNVALSKVFDEVGKATKVSGHRLAINSLKSDIREQKEKLGTMVCENEELSQLPELRDVVARIVALQEEIEKREEKIRKMKERENAAEDDIEDEPEEPAEPESPEEER